MKKENLEDLRKELQEINKDFFLLLKKRKEVSNKIQKLKDEKKQYSSWDIEREKKLFKALSDELGNLSLKEKLAFSLLIEDHADIREGSYPQWSKGEHLGVEIDAKHLMNPLLLTDLEREQLNFQEPFSMIKDNL